MSETIVENTADGTGGVEGRRVHLNLAGLTQRLNDEVPSQRQDTVVGACGAAASSMVLSRSKDLCKVETVEEEE